MVAERAWTLRRWWVIGGLLLGLAAVLVSIMVLTTWEVHLFRATTQDMDFTGLVCGTPLNNPGWEVNEPCSGAVARQMAGGVLLLVTGIALIAVTITLGLATKPGKPTA